MTISRSRLRAYLPIPKVFVPALTALVTLATKITATGQFNRTEAAALVAIFGYALIAYFVPSYTPPEVDEPPQT